MGKELNVCACLCTGARTLEVLARARACVHWGYMGAWVHFGRCMRARAFVRLCLAYILHKCLVFQDATGEFVFCVMVNE